jgi:hypothetical protein
VCWKEIFGEYGLDVEVKEIPVGMWENEPWKTFGKIIIVKI